ncbi:hypothetical protein ACFV4N_08415 [Actinosynnema sp. NPDC059797]
MIADRAALHDTARRAYWEAERARRHHRRMVREVITDAPTPRAAGAATYRIVYGPARVAGRRSALAPVRAVRAVGWAAGAWVAATGYTAWDRHWQAQQRLALGTADPYRGYVVADQVRTAGPVVLVVPIPVPVPKPVVVRLPAWRAAIDASPVPIGATGSTTSTPLGSLTPTTTGGIGMSRFHLSDLAAEQAARAARYTPESMAFFGGDLQQWPEAIGHLALALSTFVKKGSAEFPVHPVVMEKLAEVYQALGVAASAANEVPALFSRAHSIDLSRHQAPRPGEHLWNVAR